jgi:hypothetical protein
VSSLGELAGRLRAEGGLLADVVREPAEAGEEPLAVAAIREGYELHHGTGRVVVTEDADLALLAGDRLYALGLAELAAAGDLHAVAVMAEVIAGSAAARAAGDDAAAEAAWERGVCAITQRTPNDDR